MRRFWLVELCLLCGAHGCCIACLPQACCVVKWDKDSLSPTEVPNLSGASVATSQSDACDDVQYPEVTLSFSSVHLCTSVHGCCVTRCPNSLMAESGTGRWVLVTADRGIEVGAPSHGRQPLGGRVLLAQVCQYKVEDGLLVLVGGEVHDLGEV
ncbi:uncharacterized protein LOC135107117 [Scylla paramamosain]|uniref:uncharacterized protein LOC135107117 n=1 Tax=Scylla paramamosain TaxID=85552 RepID=UPI003082BC08